MTSEVFYSLDWRLEVPIASRRCHPSSSSMATDAAGPEGDDAHPPQNETVVVAPTFAVQLTTQREDDGSLRTRWFSCDYETLHNISKGLEDASGALRGAAYRRIHKMVK